MTAIHTHDKAPVIGKSFAVSKRERTFEGYLLCTEVPIARTGVLHYLAHELPELIPAPDGTILVYRDESEVFNPESMRTFQGKSVVNGHPPSFVTPATYRKYACGSMFNIRRGEGDQSNLLLADLLITEPGAIADIEDGKVEVSCGYDATYDQKEDQPGIAYQLNIKGNHLALEDAGRCGPTCSIGDKKMTKRTTFFNNIRRAFHTQDAEALESAINDAEPDASDRSTNNEGNGVAVHVHMEDPKNPMANDRKSRDRKTKDEDGDRVDAIETRMDDIESKLDTLIEAMGTTDGKAAMDKRMKDKSAKDKSAKDEDPEEDEERRRVDEAAMKDRRTKDLDPDDNELQNVETKGMTKDSRYEYDAFRALVSQAEILAPGIKLPTFDAKVTLKTTQDAMCRLRRAALVQAHNADETKSAVTDALNGATFTVDRMSCDAVSFLFGASVKNVQQMREASRRGSASMPRGGMQTPADINEANRKAWGR
jgi:hypothetical protein